MNEALRNTIPEQANANAKEGAVSMVGTAQSSASMVKFRFV